MKNQKIVCGLLLLIINITLAAHANSQIQIPHKVQKRFQILKEKFEAANSSGMPYLTQVSSEIESGKEITDMVHLALAMQEIEQSIAHICDEVQKESMQLYLDKIKKDLNEAGISEEITRACICNPCITPEGSCTPACPSAQICIGNGLIPKSVTNNGSLVSAVSSNQFASNVASNVNFGGQVTISNTTDSADQFTGSLVVNGGVGIGGDVNIGGTITITNTTQSTDCKTGAVVVGGGIGVGQNLNVCGDTIINGTTIITDTTESTSCNSGAIVVGGGIGVGGNANVCGTVTITNTTPSTSCTDGSLTTGGGLGVGGDLNVCGKIHIINGTESLGCTQGALEVDGGVGIGKNLYVCGDTDVGGTLYVQEGATLNEYVDIYGPLNVYGPINTSYYITINGNPVVATDIANCNLSVGDNTNPVANGYSNTALGQSALQNNQVGVRDTAVGCEALKLNIRGNDNVAVGAQAATSLNGSDRNTVVGSQALHNADSVDDCTAIGYAALFNNIRNETFLGGDTNALTAVGAFALHDNTKGYELTAVGFKALEQNTVGAFNTAGGFESQRYNFIGYWNTSWGSRTLRYNQSFFNTAIGADALGYNVAGYDNTALGASALYANIAGFENVACGVNALAYNLLGGYNTACGSNALAYSQYSYNTAVGEHASWLNVYGAWNAVLGRNALEYAVGPFRNTVIGHSALARNILLPNFENVIIGYRAGEFLGTFVPGVYYNVIIGSNANRGQYASYGNTIVGDKAGSSGITDQFNTLIGYESISFNPKADQFDPLQQANPVYLSVGLGARSAVYPNPEAGRLSAYHGIAIGASSRALASGAVAVGGVTSADGLGAIAIGFRSQTPVSNSGIALGYSAVTKGQGAISIGAISQAPTDYSIAVGYAARSNNQFDISIGYYGGYSGALEKGSGGSIAIGTAAYIQPGKEGIALGNRANATENGGIAIGKGAKTTGANAIALGGYSYSLKGNTIAIGYQSNVGADEAIAIGYNAKVVGYDCVVIGSDTISSNPQQIVIGPGVKAAAEGPGSIHIGNTVAGQSITIGATTATPTSMTLGSRNILSTYLYGAFPIPVSSPTYGFLQMDPVTSRLIIAATCPGCFASIPFSSEEEFETLEDENTRLNTQKFAELRLSSFRTPQCGDIQIGLSKQHVDEVWPELIGIIAGPEDTHKFYINQEMLAVAEMQMQLEDHRRLTSLEEQVDVQAYSIEKLQKEVYELSKQVQKLNSEITK
jgi:hypothetical protein